MRVMKHHDEHAGSPLVCFAEIVCRDPFSIVGRYPNPEFRLADLAQMRFATVSEVPTPWLCLQEDLRQVGIDPDRLDRVADCSMAENLAALRQGQIDAAQFFEPFVEETLATGAGYLWHAASSRGRTTYTAFVTTRDRLLRDPEPLLRMTRAIYRTQQWLKNKPADQIADTIKSFFPVIDPAHWRAPSPVTERSEPGEMTRLCPRTVSTGCAEDWSPAVLSAARSPFRPASTIALHCKPWPGGASNNVSHYCGTRRKVLLEPAPQTTGAETSRVPSPAASISATPCCRTPRRIII